MLICRQWKTLVKRSKAFGENLLAFFAFTELIPQPTPFDALCQNVVESIAALREYIEQFRQAGQDCIAGFLEGAASSESLETVKNCGANLGTAFLTGFRETTGWHSPWSSTIKACWDAIKGLFLPTEDDAAKDPGRNLGNKTLEGYDEATDGKFEEKAGEAADGLVDGAVKNGDKAEAAGTAMGSRMLQGLGKVLENPKAYAKEQIEKVTGAIDEYADVDKNDGLVGLSGLGFDTDETDSVVNELTETISNTVTQATNNSSGAFTASGTKAADTFLTAFEQSFLTLIWIFQRLIWSRNFGKRRLARLLLIVRKLQEKLQFLLRRSKFKMRKLIRQIRSMSILSRRWVRQVKMLRRLISSFCRNRLILLV